MTDAERVLAVLIHDVRTPLGVAHGYLRLVRGDKLPTPADPDRALASTQEALARISRLCQDAGLFLEDPPGPAAGRAPAAELARRVAAILTGRGLPIVEPPPTAGTVAVGTSIDRAAEAIATLLAVRATPLGASVTIGATRDTLRFAAGPPARVEADTSTGGAEEAYDPWKSSQGLGVIVAHRLVTALGGRVTTAGPGLALALAMPMETGNE